MAASGLVISQIKDAAIVSFRDSSILDGQAVDAIAKKLYALVDEQAHRKIILEFDFVRFLSSSMLGVLIALQKKSKAIKGRFVIASLREDLRKVFQITRLDKILEFADSEATALKMLDVKT